jgi:hypothetical protein
MRLEADAPELEPPSADRLDQRRFGVARLREPVARVRELVASLFAPVRRTRITGPAVFGAALAIVVTAAYSLLRVGGAGAFNSIWAEDGANFLSDAYMLPTSATIFRSLNGYFVVLPRLITEVASVFPVAWGPAVLSTGAALFSGAMAVMVYVASGNVLVRPFLRAVCAFWIVAAPLAESTHAFGPNMVAPLQFVELYGLFWALMWTPVRYLARLVQVVFVVLCCMSTILVVLLIPLAVLRLWAVRTKWSMLLLSTVVAGSGFHAVGLILGLASRGDISHPRTDPLWALGSYVGWALPFGVTGEKTMSDPGFTQLDVHSGGGGPWYWSGVIVAWLVVAVVILAACRRLTRPQWLFAAVAASESVLLLCGQIMVQGRLELRYAYTPSLLAITALLALLRPLPVSRHDPRTAWLRVWFPAMALTLLLAVSAATNYRTWTNRTRAIPWRVQVEQSALACRADPRMPFVLTYSVDDWFVQVPCLRVR